MKKQTKYLLILTIICTLLSFVIMFIFFQPEYRGTSGTTGGFGLLCVCIYHYRKLWRAHKNEAIGQTLETKLSDERNNKIELYASRLSFFVLITLLIITAFIALYLHFDLLYNALLTIVSFVVCFYGVCVAIYHHIY